MDALNQKGSGYAAALIAEVDNFEAYYDAVKAKDVQMLSFEGSPLDDNTKGFVLQPSGKNGIFPFRRKLRNDH